MRTISIEAMAQAWYALFEKHFHVAESLESARRIFPEDSANVVFWRGEETRVRAALVEMGGRP